MSRTITALFDTRADAQAAKERLQEADLDADNIHIHDQTSTGARSEGEYSTHEDRGLWASIKNAFLPDEDRHVYEEGVRRGGALLTADVDEDEIDEAVRVLESSNSIDIDNRAQEWRSSGWDYDPTIRSGSNAVFGGMANRDSAYVEGDSDRAPETVAEEAIPVVQENLVVGKREVDRGGVRVRSYVTETPVSEQIRLRNERVEVERRAVDQPLSAVGTDAFAEQTIEMTATGEEAVVGKQAKVVEEVVVRKSAEEHDETVSDTVRRTDVEVDRDVDRKRD